MEKNRDLNCPGLNDNFSCKSAKIKCKMTMQFLVKQEMVQENKTRTWQTNREQALLFIPCSFISYDDRPLI